MSNFWDTVFQPPTTGETLPPPLNDPFGHLLGTSAGLDTSVNDAGAEAVFPALSPDPEFAEQPHRKGGQAQWFRHARSGALPQCLRHLAQRVSG